jgi:hypothetical protein
MNLVIKKLYTSIRDAIPATVNYFDRGFPELDFAKTRKNLFYEIKTGSFWHYISVQALKWALDHAPLFEKETGVIDKGFYKELLGDKFFPDSYQVSKSPLDCFLKNAPAMCKHNSQDTEAVLDLDYLSKYEVKEGFERYGGKAILKIEKGKYELQRVEKTGYDCDQKKATCIFLSSFAVHIVFVRHAIMTHLSVAQHILVKFLDIDQEKRIKANLRLQELLQVLTTRVNEVSLNELLLIGGNGLVDRVCSFAPNVLEIAGKDVYNQYANMEPQQLISILSEGSKQWASCCKNRVFSG